MFILNCGNNKMLGVSDITVCIPTYHTRQRVTGYLWYELDMRIKGLTKYSAPIKTCLIPYTDTRVRVHSRCNSQQGMFPMGSHDHYRKPLRAFFSSKGRRSGGASTTRATEF